MAPLSPNNLYNFVFFSSLFFISIASTNVSAYKFQIGGSNGWVKPTGNETQTYDEWATKNRFHVGDSIYFKYKNDSVLIVNRTDYINCDVSNPIHEFDDGNTMFRFDRYGFFYFISGKHCKSGQRVVIRVMVHPGVESPESAPSPSDGREGGSSSGDWGPPTPNSTIKLSVASYFMTSLGGVLVILYMFM